MTYSRTLIHGTVQGYNYRGCRCEECRQAYRDYYGHRPRAVVDAERAARHGTEAKYRAGCRCDDCRTAASARRNERRRTPNVAVHGTHSGYSNGCRCDDCRDASMAYQRGLRRRRKATA